jgi:hypothetical protein
MGGGDRQARYHPGSEAVTQEQAMIAESLVALALIISLVCGVLALAGWLAERKQPDPITRYQARWKTQGFRGW